MSTSTSSSFVSAPLLFLLLLVACSASWTCCRCAEPPANGQKVICVTGANKGIGLEIVRLLCQTLKPPEKYKVLLAARSAERAQAALEELKKDDLPITPVFVQLDIRDEQQCRDLRDRIKEEFGGLDMLVNNAAVGFRRPSLVPLHVQVPETIETNYFGTKKVTDILLPILRDDARIINVVSAEALEGFKCMEASTRRTMLAPDLTLEELDDVMRSYLERVPHDRDWGELTSYRLSKAAVVAWTRRSAQLADEGRLPGLQAKNVFISSVHPGICKTDMAGWDLPRFPASHCAAVVVDVCLNGTKAMHGKYVENGQVIEPYSG